MGKWGYNPYEYIYDPTYNWWGPPCPSFRYFYLTCLRQYRHVEGDLASKFGAKSDFRKADQKMRCTGYSRNNQAEYDLLFGIKILIKVHSLSTILCVCCVDVDILYMFEIIFV